MADLTAVPMQRIRRLNLDPERGPPGNANSIDMPNPYIRPYPEAITDPGAFHAPPVPEAGALPSAFAPRPHIGASNTPAPSIAGAMLGAGAQLPSLAPPPNAFRALAPLPSIQAEQPQPGIAPASIAPSLPAGLTRPPIPAAPGLNISGISGAPQRPVAPSASQSLPSISPQPTRAPTARNGTTAPAPITLPRIQTFQAGSQEANDINSQLTGHTYQAPYDGGVISSSETGRVYRINPRSQAELQAEQAARAAQANAQVARAAAPQSLYSLVAGLAASRHAARANKISPLGELAAERAKLAAANPNDPMLVHYDNAIVKASTHQPAASQNVAVNTDKNFLGKVADIVGKDVGDAIPAARRAAQNIEQIRSVSDDLKKNNIILGPGADLKIAWRQIGATMGITGKNNDEILTATRSAMQLLAKSELAQAQQNHGEGSLTQPEREIIRKASSGQINDLSAPELDYLLRALDKNARFTIRFNNANRAKLGKSQEAGMIGDFMHTPEPPPIYKRSVGDVMQQYGGAR